MVYAGIICIPCLSKTVLIRFWNLVGTTAPTIGPDRRHAKATGIRPVRASVVPGGRKASPTPVRRRKKTERRKRTPLERFWWVRNYVAALDRGRACLLVPWHQRRANGSDARDAKLLVYFQSGIVPAPDGQIKGLVSTNHLTNKFS